ncbi:NAD dependent epimerase/dehydratase family protein [Aspergillus ambiguus]|uniref:NAD-dependent epimerase/dehydratase family protein n=1 Tax=Aspergillus ambiguus TaxID=176160 RepID=UPI003CCE2D85
MPNVLILGATGYIGLALAQSLRRGGTYTVWGTARTPEKAKLLMANEVFPVGGDITDSQTLSGMITGNQIDIVVDASSAYDKASQILNGVVHAGNARRQALAAEGIVGPKLGFLYISGTWVHGSPSSRVSDLSPVGSRQSKGKPAPVAAWRPAHEQAILATRDILDAAIVRPGDVYGRSSPGWTPLWEVLQKSLESDPGTRVQIPAAAAARIGTVHVDDVAAGLHTAVDHLGGQLGSWPVFDLVTETVSIVEIMETAKAVLGVEALLDYIGPVGDPFMEAMSCASKLDASRARYVLGWTPKRTEFLLNLSVYIKAWLAAR